MSEEQVLERAKRAKEMADALKDRLDQATLPDEKLNLAKDYWFYKGKLEAYRDAIGK